MCDRRSRKRRRCSGAAAPGKAARRRRRPPKAGSLMADAKPIIIIKKRGGHGGHHGGAWKVAYADFVTAMMALFIVLWLLNSTPQVKKAVSGYFNEPRGQADKSGTDRPG